MPPSHFKGKAISPTERLDVTPQERLQTVENNKLPKPIITSEIVNSVTEPSPEKINPTPHISITPEKPANKEAEIKETSQVIPVSEIPVVETELILEKNKAPVSLPVIELNRPERKVSGLSFKSIEERQKMQRELQSQEPDTQNLPTDPFTEESLIEAWAIYTQLVQKDGKHILYSHLTMGEPKLDGTLIHLIFPNNTIKLEVEREQGDLLAFIKKKLNNYDIDLSIEVKEEAAKKYAYTTREKFDKLNQKNPLLDKLRQKFDLDL